MYLRGGKTMNHLGRWCGLFLGALAVLATSRTAAAAVPEKMQKQIDAAIEKGSMYLKGTQQANGSWSFKQPKHDPGATALAAWALLECKVPRNDPSILKAAAVIRKELPAEREIYHISLYILFLDKLRDIEDLPLIEALSVRLMSAEQSDGGWGYRCNEIPAAEVQRLQTIVANRKNDGSKIPEEPDLPRKLTDLNKDTQQQLRGLKFPPNQMQGNDNSNTQFAMIALWVTRRYGMPVDSWLKLTGQRFFAYQRKDGRWLYPNLGPKIIPTRGAFSQSMTCAGLLGLAVGFASDDAAQVKMSLHNHESVKRGFSHLVQILNGNVAEGFDQKNTYYFLWSLERVGVAYSVETFYGKDWYLWGADFLLRNQDAGGSWPGGGYGDCDTCFALLFLVKANPYEDLQEKLRRKLAAANAKKTNKEPDDKSPFSFEGIITKDPPKKKKKTSSLNRSPALPAVRGEPLAAVLPCRDLPVVLDAADLRGSCKWLYTRAVIFST
jgi:hypothetical protein